ncbi:cytochrome c [Phenylobacterium aquaticum]|uniref:c-type cytochrome n=1 Tax=Phenylobacterium aquaticum TaxID=1763816 RepID=UPI0026F2CD12|nr:cytochrome c [Phenylobacterium aquaticum]
MASRLLPTFAVALCLATAARAETPQVAHGHKLAQDNCSACHAIGRHGRSRNRLSPPFRTLHDRYPVEDIQESLVEGISTGHHGMPVFQFDEAASNDLIAYLKTLEAPKK